MAYVPPRHCLEDPFANLEIKGVALLHKKVASPESKANVVASCGCIVVGDGKVTPGTWRSETEIIAEAVHQISERFPGYRVDLTLVPSISENQLTQFLVIVQKP